MLLASSTTREAKTERSIRANTKAYIAKADPEEIVALIPEDKLDSVAQRAWKKERLEGDSEEAPGEPLAGEDEI